MTTLGRCHQIQIKADNKPVSAVEFIAKVPIYIYVNMAGQFTNENSKSKVEVKVQQRLYIDVKNRKESSSSFNHFIFR